MRNNKNLLGLQQQIGCLLGPQKLRGPRYKGPLNTLQNMGPQAFRSLPSFFCELGINIPIRIQGLGSLDDSQQVRT